LRIGNLANCDIVSRAEGSDETWVLRLERGKATAQLERERRKARQIAGTTVVLSDLEPDVLRVLTQRKVVDYLRARRGPALARGDYSIEVVEGRSVEVVSPEKPENVKLEVPAHPTLWGRIEFALYVSPPDTRRRVVRDDETGLLDYLATLVAKEYVLYNNPRAANEDLAEEMVRMLVRVRRHLPKRR
jgi:hypothetical protein